MNSLTDLREVVDVVIGVDTLGDVAGLAVLDAGANPGCNTGPMLSIGVVALGIGDVDRAAAFWCEALGYEIRTDGFGGWTAVLTPPAGGAGPKIALQRIETPPQDHPRLHLDLVGTSYRAAALTCGYLVTRSLDPTGRASAEGR